jgi:hypothetical protein
MTVQTLSYERDPAAFPTLSEAAEMIGVDKSTVSRADIDVVQAGANKRVLPTQLLTLAMTKRRRLVTQVAAALISYTRAHAPAELEAVEREVDEFFASVRGRETPSISRDDFLDEARRLLTAAEFKSLQRRYDEAVGRRPAELVSSYEGEDA